MQVAMVNRMAAFTRGGGEIWDIRMAERLVERGVDVTMVTAAPLRGDPPDPVTAVPTVEVRTPHLLETAFGLPPGPAGALADLDVAVFGRRARSAVEDVDPDLLHVNAWPRLAGLSDAVDGPSVIKLNGPPHSLWYDVLWPFGDSYDRLDGFDAVVTTGVTTDRVADRSRHDPVEIDPGVDTERFAPAAAGPPPVAGEAPEGAAAEDGAAGDSSAAGSDDGLDLLFVGRFVPAKDLGRLVDAVAALPDEIDVALTLVGDGPQRDAVERRVAAAGIEDAVTFAGYVDNEDLPAHYRAADALVLSSRHENYPIVLLEAMSCGTPGVAPDVGAVDRIVGDGEDGLLYPAGDVAALTARLERLHDDPALADRLGRAARDRAVAAFDWGDRAARLERLYRDLLGVG